MSLACQPFMRIELNAYVPDLSSLIWCLRFCGINRTTTINREVMNRGKVGLPAIDSIDACLRRASLLKYRNFNKHCHEFHSSWMKMHPSIDCLARELCVFFFSIQCLARLNAPWTIRKSFFLLLCAGPGIDNRLSNKEVCFVFARLIGALVEAWNRTKDYRKGCSERKKNKKKKRASTCQTRRTHHGRVFSRRCRQKETTNKCFTLVLCANFFLSSTTFRAFRCCYFSSKRLFVCSRFIMSLVFNCH